MMTRALEEEALVSMATAAIEERGSCKKIVERGLRGKGGGELTQFYSETGN